MNTTMNITYEREVGHCEPSRYIKMVTIANVRPADNSDNLDCITFMENGWQGIAQRGRYSAGDQVMFVVPESVLPFELSEALDVTKYLSKGRVKRVKLRGNRSEGLIVPKEIVEPYIPHILQWEDPPTVGMQGETMPRAETPFEFDVFHKIPNLFNEPETLIVGEKISWSEKIHGTNCRFGVFKNPATDEYQLYVGTHNTVRKEMADPDMYWRVVKTTLSEIALDFDAIPRDRVFYCEIFGKGVQHMIYDLAIQKLRVFAIMDRDARYFAPPDVARMCAEIGMPCVEFHEGTFEGLDWARTLSNMPSELYEGHREGVVIVPHAEPKRMVKVIGDEYLEGKKGKKKEKRTERH